MFRALTRVQSVVDTVLAVGLTLVFVTQGFDSGTASLIVLVGFAVALFLRRRSPVLALAVSWVVAIGQMAAGLPTQPSNIAILFVLYASAAYGSARLRWIGLASAVLGGVVAALYLTFIAGQPYVPFSSGRSAADIVTQVTVILVAAWGVLGLSWALGRISLANRTSVEEKHQRALAKMEQAQAVQQIAVEHERNRIARDMHDIVAHSLAVVIAQADGARYARTDDPESVDRALTTIAGTARDALRDVRGVLSQLRHDADDNAGNGSRDIDTLIDRMRGAGLTIDVVGKVDPEDLGAGGHMTLYRIAQEALTNALRHGDSRVPVSVCLETVDAATQLTVRNRISATTPATSSGHGLVGMRERVALSGGNLIAGPDGKDWTLVARLPSAEVVS